MITSTMTLDDVVRTTRQRQAALTPFDFTDRQDRYEFRWPESQPPMMARLSGDRVLSLSPRAETQLLQRLGVPVQFFRRMPPNLRWAVANHFNINEPAISGTLIRTVRGNTVRALLSESYAPLDDVDVLPLVADVLADQDARVEKLDFSDDATHLRIVFNRELSQVRPGDIIQTGVHITNSEVGLRAVHVDALVHRLVCSNGLVRAESQGRTTFRHIGQADRLKDGIAIAIRDARDNAQLLSRQFRDSVQHRLAEPEDLLRRQAKDGELTKDQLQAALAAFAIEPDSSLFGVANAITRAAQAEPTFEARYQMERQGAALLARLV